MVNEIKPPQRQNVCASINVESLFCYNIVFTYHFVNNLLNYGNSYLKTNQ